MGIENKQGRVFQRGSSNVNLLFRHEHFFVVANLEEGYQPMLNISVMPWSTKDLAPSIWHKLYLDSLRPEMKSEAYSSCDVCHMNIFTCLLVATFAMYKQS